MHVGVGNVAHVLRWALHRNSSYYSVRDALPYPQLLGGSGGFTK